MPQIKLLPEYLINQIAAGEVVERPASVVKELVENSIDAGATHITIEIEGGGDSFLRITDDGSGMDKDDAVLALERHATSKIATTEDLTNIHSLGFRGEAIASIASVSYLILQTKLKGALEGTLVLTEGGEIKKTKAVGVPEGTQIEVKQLFYNTPARKKYLKNPVTEYNHIFNTVTGLALAFPQVAFKLVHDEKVVFDLPQTEERLERIRSLMGKTLSDELIPVFYGHSLISLEGFIGKPVIARGNRNVQYLFVNNREVKSHVLSYAVKESYHSLLPKEKYPVFFLYFKIDPVLVDVNVHPRKQEVRFSDEREIFRIANQACQKALEDHVLAPRITQDGPVNYYQERSQMGLKLADKDADMGYKVGVMAPVGVTAENNNQTRTDQNISGSTIEAALNFTEEFAKTDQSFVKRSETEEIFALAQLNNAYILCQQGPSLVLVDQHAAHERIRYTEILEDFEKQSKDIQPLLMPFQFELSQNEISILDQNQEILKGMGFEIENFGGNTFSIQAVPSFIAKEDLQKTILGLIDDLGSQTAKGDFQQRKERSLIYMACRSAKKFGDPLSLEEQKALIKKLLTLALPYTCPHGRPTMITLSADELKKRFGREYR